MLLMPIGLRRTLIGKAISAKELRQFRNLNGPSQPSLTYVTVVALGRTPEVQVTQIFAFHAPLVVKIAPVQNHHRVRPVYLATDGISRHQAATNASQLVKCALEVATTNVPGAMKATSGKRTLSTTRESARGVTLIARAATAQELISVPKLTTTEPPRTT